MSIQRLALLVLLATGCASPPVWRSQLYGPSQPVPTLAAASVFEFYIPPTTVDLTGVNIGDALEAFGKAAVENPDAVMRGIDDAKNAVEARLAIKRNLVSTAPSMHDRAVAFLQSQGFEIEVDAGRSAVLTGKGFRGEEYDWVAPGTASNPFGSPGEPASGDRPAREDGLIPMWGNESKSNLVEALATDREREAYASIHAKFTAPGNNPANGLSCKLIVQVIDRNEQLVFEGRATGSVATSSFNEAFDAALAQMRQPVLR